MTKLYKKIGKLMHILTSGDNVWNRALRFGVAAAIEHRSVLRQFDFHSIVDIGANQGQFALIARHFFPKATIISCEPLPGPAERFQRVFAKDQKITLHMVAIGPTEGLSPMHVSAKDDSSSLLPISALQELIYSGTSEVGQLTVEIGPLNKFLQPVDVTPPALLKIDVQGYELEVLRGCEDLLKLFSCVYVECSFMELYTGQAMTHEIISWLRQRDFILVGVYNMSYDKNGSAVQGDFLFKQT